MAAEVVEWGLSFSMNKVLSRSMRSSTLKDTYRTMPDKVKRLNHLMEAHYLHIAPENIALRPPI